MPTVMILGPSFDNHIEPSAPPTTTAPTPGRRQFIFDTPPTSPGGNVHLKLQPAASPSDAMPVNVYAFFVQPVESVPSADQRTADWFFKSGAPNSSIHAAAIAADGTLKLTVPGVKPSLQPYFVQTVLEFNS
jgi:hypothetical protein